MTTSKVEMKHFQKRKMLLLRVVFRWVASPFCELTLDFKSVSSSIYCKMPVGSSFHRVTGLPAELHCHVVTHTVLNSRTSPLTPQAANRWRLKESSAQVPWPACTSQLQTSQITAAYHSRCLFQRLKILFIRLDFKIQPCKCSPCYKLL